LLNSPKVLGGAKERVRWHFDFMGASRWFFSLSGCILLVGALALATKQLNLGIDFESGTRIEVALTKPTNEEGVRETLDGAGVPNAEVQRESNPGLGSNAFQIQSQTLLPGEIKEVQSTLEEDFGIKANAFDSTSVGPTFGQTIANSARNALIFSLLIICAYIAFRFDPKFAVPVLIALFHDILITAGVYSLTGREVTSGTVAAFLTILGYSMYDTIIVFDRVRENVPRLPRATFSQIANRSLSEVLTRSLITGLSTVFLIGVILIFGGETLRDFAFAMMIGVLSGTYSSIFIASPVLIAWKEREPAYQARAARIAEQMGYVPPFPEDNEVALVGGEPEREPAKGSAAVGDGGDGDGGDGGAAVEEERPRAPVATAPAGEGNGAEPDASEAEMTERERRMAARRRRQASQKRKHGRNR